MILHKSLPRRTFLRGFGTAIALPFLDAMAPALAAVAARPQPPRRMVFVYVPNGIVMNDWTPQETGPGFDLPRILEPLAPLRDDVLLLTGLAQHNGRALGDGPGDHARAAATFLTGVHPKKTPGADIHVGISADQVAAQRIGGKTRFASLEFGCEDGRLVGSCDSGYSCAYSNSISWRSATTPNPPEVNPRALFERLFAGLDPNETPASRERRRYYRKSILDFVMEDAQGLKADLGPTDQRKLDEYLTAVREIEKRIEASERAAAENESSAANALTEPPFEKPAGMPVEFVEHVRLMFDLLAVALQADLTRVATFMMGREGSGRTYREIGISDSHHPLTHHRNNAEMIDKVVQINRYHMQQFVYFLDKLRSTKDGDGSLLDHAMVLYGSGLSDGNKHWHHDLPALLAGRGGGTIRAGRHLSYKSETPMNNLFLSMLDRVGVPTETLGDSTGKLEHLSDL